MKNNLIQSYLSNLAVLNVKLHNIPGTIGLVS